MSESLVGLILVWSMVNGGIDPLFSGSFKGVLVLQSVLVENESERGLFVLIGNIRRYSYGDFLLPFLFRLVIVY